MAEPKHERISAALAERFRTIHEDGGTHYHYTVGDVVRVVEFQGFPLDESQDLMYFLRADESTESEGTTGTSTLYRTEGRATFSVLLVKRDGRTADNPVELAKESAAIPPTVVSRMVSDLRHALFSEPTLIESGTSEALAWNVASGPVSADLSYQIGHPWLSAMVTFTVAYDDERTKAS